MAPTSIQVLERYALVWGSVLTLMSFFQNQILQVLPETVCVPGKNQTPLGLTT